MPYKVGFKGVDCAEHAPDVKVPILIAGMKADVYAGDDKEIDVQKIFDAVTTEKPRLLLVNLEKSSFSQKLVFW